MNTAISWALDRAKEPSTWAGLAGLAMVFGISASRRVRSRFRAGSGWNWDSMQDVGLVLQIL